MMRAIVIGAVFCVLGGLVTVRHVNLVESRADAAEVAGLRDTLMNGLEARLPHDRAFINKVVDYVNKNKLPLKPVMEIFQYCRKKVAPRRRATVFRILMKRRGKEIGVPL